MLAETRVGLVHRAAKRHASKSPPFSFEERPWATLESAKRWDQLEGNFAESAHHYHNILLSVENPLQRSEALIGCTQQLINLTLPEQARGFLETRFPEVVLPLTEVSDRMLLKARAQEKMGWIEDAELGYFQTLATLNASLETLNSIPQSQWGDIAWKCYSTDKHFRARSEYGLAFMGVNRAENIRRALADFNEAEVLDRDSGRVSSEQEVGFNCGWKAKCHILLDEMGTVDHLIEEMGDHFRAYLRTAPHRGIMAQYYLVKGFRDLHLGLTVDARRDFEEAVDIRVNDKREDYEPFPKGLAHAYAGLAGVSWKERHFRQAWQYLKQARRTDLAGAVRYLFGG